MAGKSSPNLRRGVLLTQPLRSWKRGDPLTAVHLQEAIDAITALSRGIDLPSVEPGLIPGEEDAASQRFVVVEVYGDYLTARKQGGDAAGDVSTQPTINVALPPQLQRTPHDVGETAPYLAKNGPAPSPRDGVKYEYVVATVDLADGTTAERMQRTATATDPDVADEDQETETQEVIPPYVAGDVIFATRDIGGGTGVWTAPQTADPVEVEWQEINADGRAWAKV